MTLLHISDLSYMYPSGQTQVLSSLSFSIGSGWTGVVGANGSGKSTLLRLIAGELTPTEGSASVSTESGHRASVVYCDQRVETVPDEFDEFLNSWDERAIDLIRALDIDYRWLFRWDTLSFGERKRAQIATALWRAPDVLAVDEPTNHLDIHARRLLADALAKWDGVGLIVSHDRQLLDRLCDRCLFLAGGKGLLRPGGISLGLAEEERERATIARLRDDASREEKRLRREAHRRTVVETGSSRRLSKRDVSKGDHDLKAKIDGARLTGKDRRASDAARLMRERAEAAADRRRSLRVMERTFVSAPGSLGMEAQPSESDTICSLPSTTITVDADDTGPAAFSLVVPDLVIGPTSRVGIAGGNGTGKSTLLATLHRVVPPGRDVWYLQQELNSIDLFNVRETLDELDRQQRGRVLAIVAGLGTDPGRILNTKEPSPGEARKLLIALAILRRPAALFLDEPTNHLDLPSVLALESSLKEYSGALVVVSHDEQFLTNVVDRRWHITSDAGSGCYTLKT